MYFLTVVLYEPWTGYTFDLLYDGSVEARVGSRQVLQILQDIDQLVSRRLIASLEHDSYVKDVKEIAENLQYVKTDLVTAHV